MSLSFLYTQSSISNVANKRKWGIINLNSWWGLIQFHQDYGPDLTATVKHLLTMFSLLFFVHTCRIMNLNVML